MSDNLVVDDNGNTNLTFEDAVASFAGGVEAPEPEPTEATEEVETNSEEDEINSILDELDETDEEADDKESDDSPEETSEEEEPEDEESEEDDNQEFTVKVDGEEQTVTLAELKKGYGLNKSLTQKGQAIAEERKKLDEEAQAVAWAKAKPEMKALQEQIKEAEQAIQRGYVLEDGQPIYLTPEQIAQTQKNVQEAVADYQAKNKPPRLDELYEKVPEMAPSFNDDAQRQAKLDSFANTLQEFGYSQAEIQAHDDPRTFLMMQELQELRELQSKVNNAKAKRADKPKVVDKVAKGKTAKAGTPKAKSKTLSAQDFQKGLEEGSLDWADGFM